MNFNDILKELEQAGPAVYEQQNDRRQVLKSFGSKVAVAALPFAIGSLFQKAQAKTTATDSPVDVLNFALQLEYLAYNYYHTANNTGGLIPGGDQPGFLTIENQKKAHILFLQATIVGQGGTPFTPKNYDATAANPLYIVSGTYDFTAGGKYQVFNYYPDFLMISEVIEDTLVHGYKGGIINSLLESVDVLEIMMRLQAATGRHAAHARFVRRNLGFTQAPEHPAPWITNNIPPDAKLQAYYVGEEVVSQQGTDITTLPGKDGNTPFVSATAGFDEPLDKTVALNLLSPFMIK